jgi:prepilin-type processing-associated H-X9-DG protein
MTDVLLSSPGPEWAEPSDLRCHYFAIFGAKPSDCGRGGSIEGLDYPDNTYTIDACNMSPQSSGGRATNGVLYFESKTTFRKITDGTSKTMMYGEISWDSGVNMTWLAGDDPLGTISPAADIWIFNGKQILNPINSAAFPLTWREADGGESTVAYHDVSLGSKHPGGCHVLMCDSSVHFIQESIELATLKAMASRASEDIYEAPF